MKLIFSPGIYEITEFVCTCDLDLSGRDKIIRPTRTLNDELKRGRKVRPAIRVGRSGREKDSAGSTK
jgi:hypothetical protein